MFSLLPVESDRSPKKMVVRCARLSRADEKSQAITSNRGGPMITEVVTFKLPTGMTREQLISNYRQTAPKWRENPDLVRKNYLYDGTNGLGGGVYLWKDIAAGKKWH